MIEGALSGPSHLIVTTQIIDNDEELLGKGRLLRRCSSRKGLQV